MSVTAGIEGQERQCRLAAQKSRHVRGCQPGRALSKAQCSREDGCGARLEVSRGKAPS